MLQSCHRILVVTVGSFHLRLFPVQLGCLSGLYRCQFGDQVSLLLDCFGHLLLREHVLSRTLGPVHAPGAALLLWVIGDVLLNSSVIASTGSHAFLEELFVCVDNVLFGQAVPVAS